MGFWIPPAAFIVVIVTAIVVLKRHRLLPGMVKEESCAKCGYGVRDLTSNTCPECGSDLDEVLVQLPGRAPRGFAWIVVASVFIFAVVWGVLIGVASLLPERRVWEMEIGLDTPRSGAYAAATIVGRGVEWAWPNTEFDHERFPLKRFTVTLTMNDGTMHDLRLETVGDGFDWRPRLDSQAPDGTLDGSDVEAWLSSLPLAADSTLLSVEATTIAVLVNVRGVMSEVSEYYRHATMQERAGNPGFPFRLANNGGGGGSTTDELYRLGTAPLAWIVGLLWIHWYVRRLRAGAEDADPGRSTVR